jgi:hypothetical protein
VISQKTTISWRRICFLNYFFINYVIVPSIGEFVATQMSLWLAACDKATYNWSWLNKGWFNSTVFRLAPCALFIVKAKAALIGNCTVLCPFLTRDHALSVTVPLPYRYCPQVTPLPQRGFPFLKNDAVLKRLIASFYWASFPLESLRRSRALERSRTP